MKVEERNTLKVLLQQFKVLTLNIIKKLEEDDFDSIGKCLDIRQSLILDIEKISYSDEEFKVICKEIELLPIQQKLIILFNKKKLMLKNEINAFEVTRVANKSYNKENSIDSLYFNKKI